MAVLTWLVVVAPSSPASAWIFPEHAELGRIGYDRYLPEPAQREIQALVVELSKDGSLHLCPEASVTFTRIAMNGSAARCIPFTALPALAGDHAATMRGFLTLLRNPISGGHTTAQLVVGASVDVWTEYLSDAPIAVTRAFLSNPGTTGGDFTQGTNGETNGRAMTRDLDLRLQVVDHDYGGRAAGTHAHFQDAVTPLSELLQALTGPGNADNTLAQMLAHHVRSLQLAASAQALPHGGPERRQLLTAAMLEHAFAVHFMQDAFAAGHIGTEPGMEPAFDRLRRHDFLNRHGLSVTRLLALQGCQRNGSQPSSGSTLDDMCWTAYGDGYLDENNIPYGAEASARLQLQFAMALGGQKLIDELTDPCVGRTVSAPTAASPAPADMAPQLATTAAAASPQATERDDRPSSGEPACALAMNAFELLDPSPAWTVTDWAQRRRASDIEDARYIVHVVRSAGSAVLALTEARFPMASFSANAGAQSSAQPGALSAATLGDPLTPCSPQGSRDAWNTGKENWMCPHYERMRLGTPDVSLWRPLLVAWPTSRADVRTLAGADSFGAGLAFQVIGGLAGQVGLSSHPPVALGGWGGLGIAVRAEALMPNAANLRPNFAFLELNLGVGPVFLSGIGETRYATLGITEVRVPAITVGLFYGLSYLFRSADLVDFVPDEIGVGPNGFRLYWSVPAVLGAGFGEFDLLGWDIEVAYWALGGGPPRTQSIGNATGAELRLRVGYLDLTKLNNREQSDGHSVTVALEFVAGNSWFF